ncbi:MuF-C-terminal domain-containing protein, partial [Prevotella disiens]|uniref:MuF-C-terminal domain-containing protein n=1 Tax=Prevotella disiens TaxID=28130 RepID=UPI00056543A8
EVVSITDAMKANAVIAPTVEINDANWKESVDTPIGTVKMGENQKAKLFAKGREQQYGMLLETLSNPDVVLEEKDKGQNMFHERPSSYLFVKTFQKEDGSKYVHFESVTVSQDGMEVSISSHIIRENQLKNKLKSDRLLYKATALDAPANTSAEQPIVGGSLSSVGKDTQSSATKQVNEDKSTPTAKKTEERVSEYNEHVLFKYVGEREDRGNTYLYEDILYNGKEIGLHVQQQRNDDKNPLAVLQDFHEVYLLEVPVSDYDPRGGNEKWTIGGKEIEDTSLGANHILFKNEEELIDFYEKNKYEIEERRKRADYYNNRRKVTAKVEETTERDKQYLEAVQRGDMNTAKEATEQKDSSANDTARSHTFDKEVNEQFNRELAELTEENVQSKRLKLGYPSPMLSAAGVPDKPIILYGNKLLKKAKLHNFDVKDLHNLPLAMQNPIAVFEGSHPNSFATLLEIKLGGYNTLASIEVNKKGEADFNFISSLFGKESKGVTKWILDGKLLSVDKEKAQSYISASALNADATYKKELSSAAKIVKDFVNPNIGEEKLREGYGSYTNEELSFINDSWAKMIGKSNRAAFAERERSRMTNRVEELADTLHLDNVEVVTDVSQLDGNRAKAKGFYSKRTGKITIVLPNHANIADVEKTLLHEAVAHHGLRELFGEEFDNMIESIFMQVDEATRLEIMRKSSKRGWDYVTATEEYLASMAEDTNFEHVKPSVWQRIKQFFGEMLSAVGLHRAELTDNDLRYILWRSYENLKKGGKRGIFDVAEDVAMQHRLKVGNYAVSDKADQSDESDGSDGSDEEDEEG